MVYSNPRKLLLTSVGVIAIAYISTCLFLFVRQRYLIFRPILQILTLPSSRDFLLPYKDVRLPITDSNEYIHGWWIPAPLPKEKVSLISNEPVKILKSPKTFLYFCGAANNKDYYNYINLEVTRIYKQFRSLSKR